MMFPHFWCSQHLTLLEHLHKCRIQIAGATLNPKGCRNIRETQTQINGDRESETGVERKRDRTRERERDSDMRQTETERQPLRDRERHRLPWTVLPSSPSDNGQKTCYAIKFLFNKENLYNYFSLHLYEHSERQPWKTCNP